MRRGYTLVELAITLVSIGVITVLAVTIVGMMESAKWKQDIAKINKAADMFFMYQAKTYSLPPTANDNFDILNMEHVIQVTHFPIGMLKYMNYFEAPPVLDTTTGEYQAFLQGNAIYFTKCKALTTTPTAYYDNSYNDAKNNTSPQHYCLVVFNNTSTDLSEYTNRISRYNFCHLEYHLDDGNPLGGRGRLFADLNTKNLVANAGALNNLRQNRCSRENKHIDSGGWAYKLQ